MDEDYPDPTGLLQGTLRSQPDFSQRGLSHEDLTRAIQNFDTHDVNRLDASRPRAPAEQPRNIYDYPDPTNLGFQNHGPDAYEYPDPEEPDYQHMQTDTYDPDFQDSHHPTGQVGGFESTYEHLDLDDADYEDAQSDEWDDPEESESDSEEDVHVIEPASRGRGRGRPRGSRGNRGGGIGRAGRPLKFETEEAYQKTDGGKRRSQKGVKKGPRKPLDPSPEFAGLHARATEAFIFHNLDEAEHFAQQAIHANPEMFKAHSLLSEVYYAKGEKDRAIVALFNGAHTRPNDPSIWSKVADMILEMAGEDRQPRLREVIYCYNRAINADRSNVAARLKRAALNHESGQLTKAISDYTFALKAHPEDTTILRGLAEVYIDMGESFRAITYYNEAIEMLQSSLAESVEFDWSDANIYAELFIDSELFAEGLTQVKKVCRWLLGRPPDDIWDRYAQDDREFDFFDEPRRVTVPEFSPLFPSFTYGEGLPLELRVKLGILRLNMGVEHFEEAMTHFGWLDPDGDGEGVVDDYQDLFGDVGDALLIIERYSEALRFYEPIYREKEAAEMSHLVNMATCYRETSQYDQAEECYCIVIKKDGSNLTARKELIKMFDDANMPERAASYIKDLAFRRGKKFRPIEGVLGRPRRHSRVVNDDSILSTELGDSDIQTLLQTPLSAKPKPRKRHYWHEDQEDLGPVFDRLRNLRDSYRSGDISARTEWIEIVQPLIPRFRQTRPLYPHERSTKFFGYSKEAKAWATRLKTPFTADDSAWDEPIPEEFCDVPFADWLDVFLEYGILLAEDGEKKESYEMCEAATFCAVWYHSKETMFLIHVVWSVCALTLDDDECLCNMARYFMREYQFVTDSYRFFAALNRFCHRPHAWYNSGPTQKFMLRHVKAVDWSIASAKERTSGKFGDRAGRAGFYTKDEAGNPIKAEAMDVALLMVYGQLLYASGSYANALNYFYRAYALDPTNPLINLSIALSYIHHAVKRQSDNRHSLIVTGLAFLFQYSDSRKASGQPDLRQEAEFNVGRVFHLLGLTHLAVPYYERCLELSDQVRAATDAMVDEGMDVVDVGKLDFAPEAAYALQGIWGIGGNMEKASEITEKYLVI